MPMLDWRTPFAESPGTRRIPATPGIIRSTSLGSAKEVRVTARPSVGGFTRGNLNNTSTAPAPTVDTRPGWNGERPYVEATTVAVKVARKGSKRAQSPTAQRKPSSELRRGWRQYGAA